MNIMNDLGSHELKLLDTMNGSGKWMISMILAPDPKALNAMNSSLLWMT